MTATSPKPLIVSSWAPPMIGGPQNLYTLFSQYAPKSFSVLSIYRELALGAQHGGTWLPADYYFIDHAPRYYNSHTAPVSYAPATHTRFSRITLRIRHFLRNRTTVKAMILTGFVFMQVRRFFLQGLRAVREQNCAVILGLSDTGSAMLGAYYLHRRTGLPLMYYLYDIYKGNFLIAPFKQLANFFEQRMFEAARRIIVTNEGTQTFYRERYPHLADKFMVVHNSVMPEAYADPPTFNPKPPYSIVFTGHVYWAQEKSVLNLIQAMELLDDIPVRLFLYVPNPSSIIQKATMDKRNVILTRALQSEMPRVQREADVLFLPLAWGTPSPDIIRTATPGKYTDYLAAGKPMLIHAPPDAFICQYARANQLAEVVDTESIPALAAAIRRLILDIPYSRNLIENARKIFYANHNGHANALRLHELLRV